MIITFLGTKGGTGTTTMAVNAAADIHRLSRRPTIVVDATQGPGDVAVFLGLRPRYSIAEFIDQMAWSDHALAARFVAEHDSGVHVLAAPESFDRRGRRHADDVDRTVQCVAALYDFVIVDGGCRLTPGGAAALGLSDVAVLVANPDVPCLRNLQRLLDALRLAGVGRERVRVLLNRASEHGVLPLPQIERVLNRPIDFQVPSDYRTVAAAVNTGVPVGLLRTTPLHEQMDAMARSLIGPVRRAAAS